MSDVYGHHRDHRDDGCHLRTTEAAIALGVLLAVIVLVVTA